MHGVLGVGVVLAEDEGLGDEGAAGEQFGLHDILVGACRMVRIWSRHDDGAVEVLSGVGEIVVQPFLPGFARGSFAAMVHVEAFVNLAALRR